MYKKIIVFVLLFGMFSCDEYLDIVPDQTQQIDLLFERREVAYSALATCYAYLPKNDGVYTSFMMMSDEVTTPIAKETDGIRIMKGQQSSSNPKFGLWSGWQDQGSLWEGIRHCNVLIENIYNVVDMTEDEMQQMANFIDDYHYMFSKNILIQSSEKIAEPLKQNEDYGDFLEKVRARLKKRKAKRDRNRQKP